ncbi:MAG: hypothetical protein WC773_00720 [Patescibacteria group bacterium]|jgi:hypothetical protein
MKGKWLVFAVVALFATTSSFAQLSVGGVITSTDKSHNMSVMSSLVVSATNPGTDEVLGTVNNGTPIATSFVDLRFTLVLDNVELRGSVDQLVDAMIFPDVMSKDHSPMVRTTTPSYSQFQWERDKTQPRIFRLTVPAGSLPDRNGYTMKFRVWAAQSSVTKAMGARLWGNRSGEFLEASFHFMIKRTCAPKSEWEMATQLQGFNLLIEQPSEASAPARDRKYDEKHQERADRSDVREDDREVAPAPATKPVVKQQTVRASIRVVDPKTGQTIDYRGRFAVTTTSIEPIDCKEGPGFQVDETAPKGVWTGHLSHGVATAEFPSDPAKVWLVAWVESASGWSLSRAIRLSPENENPELRFRLGGSK